MDYEVEPSRISRWTNLDGFDEYEAKATGWSQEIITAAVREIQRRNLELEKMDELYESHYGVCPPEKSAIYQEGCYCYEAGWALSSNPYPKYRHNQTTREWRLWRTGWEARQAVALNAA